MENYLFVGKISAEPMTNVEYYKLRGLAFNVEEVITDDLVEEDGFLVVITSRTGELQSVFERSVWLQKKVFKMLCKTPSQCWNAWHSLLVILAGIGSITLAIEGVKFISKL